jgi:hypothetical protein
MRSAVLLEDLQLRSEQVDQLRVKPLSAAAGAAPGAKIVYKVVHVWKSPNKRRSILNVLLGCMMWHQESMVVRQP